MSTVGWIFRPYPAHLSDVDAAAFGREVLGALDVLGVEPGVTFSVGKGDDLPPQPEPPKHVPAGTLLQDSHVPPETLPEG